MWTVNEGFKESLLIIQDIIFSVLKEMHSKQAAVSSRLTVSQSGTWWKTVLIFLSQAGSLKICIWQLSHFWSMILCYLTVLLVMRYYTTRSLCATKLIRLSGNTGIHLNYLTYKSALEHKVFRDKGPWQPTKWYLSFVFLLFKSAYIWEHVSVWQETVA